MLIQEIYIYCKSAQACLIDIEEQGKDEVLPRLENLIQIIKDKGKNGALARQFVDFMDTYLALKNLDQVDYAMSLTFRYYIDQIIKDLDTVRTTETALSRKKIKPILKYPGEKREKSDKKKKVRFADL